MKILYLSEFDPAGVMIAQRDALRKFTDHEVYVGLRKSYYHKCDPDTSFPGKPDVIVVCPGIGDGSANGSGNNEKEYDPLLPVWVRDILNKNPKVPVVFYYHGSKQLAKFHAYYEHCDFEYYTAASTLDYAELFQCDWLPPVVDVNGMERAALRKPGELLRVSHTPSDPTVCSTKAFLYSAITQGVSVHYMSGRPHHEVLAAKATAHMGFDHLRGSFSVNSIECAALGVAPLFAVSYPVRQRMIAEGIYPPPVYLAHDGWESETEDRLDKLLALYRDNCTATQVAQERAFQWYHDHLRPELMVKRIVSFFEKVMS